MESHFCFTLLKGEDTPFLSTLPILVKILENLVNNQLKEFLQANALISGHHSGFRKHPTTVTAARRAVNDLIMALDKKQSCAALFIDLSLNTMDHVLQLQSLSKIELTEHAVGGFLTSGQIGLYVTDLMVLI